MRDSPKYSRNRRLTQTASPPLTISVLVELNPVPAPSVKKSPPGS